MVLKSGRVDVRLVYVVFHQRAADEDKELVMDNGTLLSHYYHERCNFKVC